MITVFIVDDHAFIRKSLLYLIEKSDDIQVVVTSSNGEEAVAQVSSRCPDVIVMDISMPLMDGIEATRQILVHCRLTRVLMLSAYDNPHYVRRAIEVGAKAYILKDSRGSDILNAIRTLSKGNYYCSREIAKVAETYLPGKGNDS